MTARASDDVKRTESDTGTGTGTRLWRGRASGSAPFRVLYLGARRTIAEGAGEDCGFLDQLADRLHRLTGHGIDVFGITADSSSLPGLTQSLRSTRAPAADAAVIEMPATITVRDWSEHREDYSQALHAWGATLPTSTPVTLLIPQLLPTTVYADLLAAAAALPCPVQTSWTRQGTYLGQQQAVDWASDIADVIAATLTEPLHWAQPRTDIDEARRIAAVRAATLTTLPWGLALQQILKQAASVYGTPNASASLIDGTRTHYLSTYGDTAPHSVQRDESICSIVLGQHAGLILEDAQADSRFRTIPVVTEGQVHFYAGYPILDPTGTPLGVLCVYSDSPRPVLSQDIDPLRDLTADAERQIWAATPAQDTTPRPTAG